MLKLSSAAADYLIDTINLAAYRVHWDADTHEALPMIPLWLLDMMPPLHPIRRVDHDATREVEAVVTLRWATRTDDLWERHGLYFTSGGGMAASINVPLLPSEDPQDWFLPATLPVDRWDDYIYLASNPETPPRLAYERVRQTPETIG